LFHSLNYNTKRFLLQAFFSLENKYLIIKICFPIPLIEALTWRVKCVIINVGGYDMKRKAYVVFVLVLLGTVSILLFHRDYDRDYDRVIQMAPESIELDFDDFEDLADEFFE